MDLQGDAGETQRSRTGDPVITPPFEAVWPDVERRLRALLYRRGLDAATADDVVQEVALRALVGRITYTSARDLLRWAGPVACNLHVDLLRQRAKLHDGDVDADHPATNDVAGEVADRMELQRAFRGIAALRPADREAIIEAVADEPTPPRSRKEAVRLAVRRHRARSRLALVLEQLAVWPAGARLLRRSRIAVTAVAVVPLAAYPLVVRSGPPPRDAVPPAVVTPATHPVDAVTRVVPVPAKPRPAPKATDRRVAPRPAPTKPAPTPPPAVDVEGSAVRVKAGGDDRRPDDGIVVCVLGLPVAPRLCV